MIIDMDLRGKTVVIFGGGTVGERKATKFLTAGASVIVASKDFTEKLRRLSSRKKLELIHADLETAPEKIKTLSSSANLIVVATNRPEINRRVGDEAKKRRIPVNVADRPYLGDFTMPDTSRIGEFRIAVSTGGKSPAMSRVLRNRIEELIRDEDILMVRLQSYARELARARIPDQWSRKKVLDTVMRDKKIRQALKKGRLQDAKHLTRRIIGGC